MSYSENRRVTEWLALAALWVAAAILLIFTIAILQDVTLHTANDKQAESYHSPKTVNNMPLANEHGGNGGTEPENTEYHWKDAFGLIPLMDHHEGFFVGIFTFCLFMSTIFLWKSTDKLFIGAEDTAKRQLRAYVGVESLNFDLHNLDQALYTPPDANAAGVFFNDFLEVNVKNFGETPAFGVTVFAYWVIAPRPNRLPEDFFVNNNRDIPNTNNIRTIVSKFILHPDKAEVVKVAINDVLPFRAAQRTADNVFVYGRIYYRDIYGRPWRTKFCSQWEWWHAPNGRFVPYEDYNGEDNQEIG